MIKQYTPCLDKAWMLGRSNIHSCQGLRQGQVVLRRARPAPKLLCTAQALHRVAVAILQCLAACALYGRFSFSLPVSQYPRRLQKFLVPTP